MKSLLSYALFALCLILISGCSGSVSQKDTAVIKASTDDASRDVDLTFAANEWADSVLASMTEDELVGQVLMPASYVKTDDATLRQLFSYIDDVHVGGIAFHKGDTLSMRAISDTLNKASSLPIFLAIDAENGLGMRLEGATVYPLNYQLTDYDQTRMYDYGRNVGNECLQVGINMVFGPVLDVAPGPGWYMYKRSLGSDPQRVADLGMAYARGIRDAGVLPVAKHFPGHGYTHTDPHVWLPVVDKPRERFEREDLLPFEKYIAEGFPAIMSAHVAVPSLTGDSIPADFSYNIITELLRNNMNFTGLIISDAVNMGAVKSIKQDEVPPPVRALLAGIDIILAPANTSQAKAQILTALRNKTLPLSTLKDHVKRILFLKYLCLLTIE